MGTTLKPHPNSTFSRLLVVSLHQGSRIGFNHQAPLKPASVNMQSAHNHPEAIDDYLTKECSHGHMLGPFDLEILAALSEFQVNRFEVIPKGHGTGKWRLITDLSYPPSSSINYGIEQDLRMHALFHTYWSTKWQRYVLPSSTREHSWQRLTLNPHTGSSRSTLKTAPSKQCNAGAT